MNELIPIVSQQFENGLVQTVNARELHAFLEVGKDFSTWIRDRIEQYNFVENHDFIIFPEIGEKSGRGRPSKEYYLSLDMAKELAMVERNEKGKQARQYFIECERKAYNPTPNPANLSRMQLIQLAMEAEQERQALENKVEEMKPDCDAFARIAVSEGSMSLTDAAKALQVQPKAFIACLSAERWIYKRLGTSWIAYQDKIQQGLLEHKVTVVQRDDGTEKSVHQVRVTPKGITRLSKLLNARMAA